MVQPAITVPPQSQCPFEKVQDPASVETDPALPPVPEVPLVPDAPDPPLPVAPPPVPPEPDPDAPPDPAPESSPAFEPAAPLPELPLPPEVTEPPQAVAMTDAAATQVSLRRVMVLMFIVKVYPLRINFASPDE